MEYYVQKWRNHVKSFRLKLIFNLLLLTILLLFVYQLLALQMFLEQLLVLWLWFPNYNFNRNCWNTLENVMKNVIMKLESNQVILCHVWSTLKSCKLKIVKISKSTPVEKLVNYELKIPMFNENFQKQI